MVATRRTDLMNTVILSFLYATLFTAYFIFVMVSMPALLLSGYGWWLLIYPLYFIAVFCTTVGNKLQKPFVTWKKKTDPATVKTLYLFYGFIFLLLLLYKNSSPDAHYLFYVMFGAVPFGWFTEESGNPQMEKFVTYVAVGGIILAIGSSVIGWGTGLVLGI